jgi:long-chain acyl-CoA synthetase
LLKHIMNTRADISAAKAFIAGGSALPSLLAHAWLKVVGKPIFQGYGLTEATATVSIGPFDDFRHGTVGKPLEGVEIEIRNDKGRTLQVGQIGEILVRGPNVMKGYHRAGEATFATITHDGWLKTGDYGMINAEGHVTITGRKKDVIIVGGESVHPQELERVVAEVPGVGEAAVISGYNDMIGEFARVCVAPIPADRKQMTQAIMAHCHAKLAPFKVPRQVDYYEQLPRNVLGKVMKEELAAGPAAPAG